MKNSLPYGLSLVDKATPVLQKMSDELFMQRMKIYYSDRNIKYYNEQINRLKKAGKVSVKFGKLIVVRTAREQGELEVFQRDLNIYIKRHYADLVAEAEFQNQQQQQD